MNKYKYIYFYFRRIIKNIEMYYVLYNENNNKFYEIEFAKLYDYLSEKGFDDKDIDTYLDEELKAGDEIELPAQQLREINRPLATICYHIMYKLMQVKNNPKFLKKVAFYALTIFLSIESTNLTNKYILPNVVEFIEENNEKNKAIPGSFDELINSNITLSNEVREKLRHDLNYLTSRTSIYDKTFQSIKKRIEKYDFSTVNENNYNACLAYLLFGEDRGLSEIIALQLTTASNEKKDDKTESHLFGLISIELTADDLTRLMNKGIEEYQDILMDNWEITKEEAQELISNLEEYSNTSDANIKENIHNKLSAYLVKKYQNINISTSFKEILLSSEIFNGNFIINHNIFSENIIIEVEDSKYGKYKLYYDKVTKEDISLNIYKEKLFKLVAEKGENLDYNDADCRFLYYLYYLCFIDSYHGDYEDILAINRPQEVLNMMVDRVFGTEGFVSLNKEFLYSYLSNGKAHINDLGYEVTYIYEYSLDVALFREYAICIEKELEAGNITKEEYDDLLGKIENWINKKLSEKNEELYNEYLRALNEDDHIFSEFSIFGNYEYHDESLNQYEYKYK